MSKQVTNESAPVRVDNHDWTYATKPTGGTLFFRTFLPYQLWRFVRINIKMIKIIRHGH